MELDRWLTIGCTTVIDQCHTIAYIAQGRAPLWKLGPDYRCACKIPCRNALNVTDEPWYNRSRPESAFFYGFMVEKITTSVPVDRDRQGLYVGPIKPARRLISITMSSVTSTCEATFYARQWLAKLLRDSDKDGQVRVTDGGVRGIADVRLVSFEVLDDDNDSCCSGERYQIVLSAQQEMFASPEVAIAEGPWEFITNEAQCQRFGQGNECKCIEESPICTIDDCGGCNFCGKFIETCGCDGDVCLAQSLVPCFCMPLVTVAKSCKLRSKWGHRVAPIIKISAGSEALRNARILAFHDMGVDLGPFEDPNYWMCREPCAEMLIPFLCENTQLTIDSHKRRVMMSGKGRTESAVNLVWTTDGRPLEWLTAESSSIWIVVVADWYNTADDALLEVLSVELEAA